MGAILRMLAALGFGIVPLARRVLAGVGFTFVIYKGLDAVISAASAQMWAYLGSLPSSIMVILGLARIDDALTLILSAVAAKMVYQGVSGAITRGRWSAREPSP